MLYWGGGEEVGDVVLSTVKIVVAYRGRDMWSEDMGWIISRGMDQCERGCSGIFFLISGH